MIFSTVPVTIKSNILVRSESTLLYGIDISLYISLITVIRSHNCLSVSHRIERMKICAMHRVFVPLDPKILAIIQQK